MINDDLKLNLPSTAFPMKAELMERVQPNILQKWLAMDIYRMILEDRRAAESFILHDGPPFASGAMHVGISFNKTIKDIIVKFWSMQGKRVPFVPGWDCHGLIIESQALKELKETDAELSATNIYKNCTAQVKSYIRAQKDYFQALGVFGDWDRPYLTMSPSYEAGVLDVLAEITGKGYVYKKAKPVNLCPVCETVLADSEVENRPVQKLATIIPFQIEGKADTIDGAQGNLYILIQTAEIWTLPAAVALAVPRESNLTPLLFRNNNGNIDTVLVEEHLSDTAQRYLDVVEKPLNSLKAEQFIGQSAKHPITGQTIPFLQKPVGIQKETNKIHVVTPAHSAEDFNLASQHKLEIPLLINKKGYFTDEFKDLSNLKFDEVDTAIQNLLADSEIPFFSDQQQLEESFSLRCGHPVIMFLKLQWFVAIDHKEIGKDKTLRERAVEEAGSQIEWIYEEDKQKLIHNLAVRPDWCISRQRYWGVPIPALICRSCGEMTLKVEVIQAVRDLVSVEGGLGWFNLDIDEFLKDPRLADLACDKCGESNFEKDSEQSVLDVWFESGTSWRSALIGDYRMDFPADLCVEGNDQHRGWFQISLLISLMVQGQTPFKSILTHGFVLDENRKAMSKKENTFFTLKESLQAVPVDLLRLYFVRNKNIREDFPLSVSSILALEPEYRVFRNCFRYLLGNLKDYTPSENGIPLSELVDIDKWILSRTHRLINAVTEDYSTFRFKEVVERIYSFCHNDLNKIYFDAVKDRLYNESANGISRRSAQTVMHSILMALVKMLAPILVYTCEEVWNFCPGTYDCSSVHLSLWLNERGGIMLSLQQSEDNLEARYDWMLKLREYLQSEFEKARRSGVIKSNREIKLTLYVPASMIFELETITTQELQKFLVISEIVIVNSPERLEELSSLKGIFYSIEKTENPECARCRQFDKTVGQDIEQPKFCDRCIRILKEIEDGSGDIHLSTITSVTRPVDIARYMRKSGIRKVALLNEGGKIFPYYFHLPSQEVRICSEFQPLADYVTNHPDFMNHNVVLLGLGDHTDILFGIGIHQLKRGTPLGGTREYTYETVGEMLENLLRLSYGMSIKNAIGNLPHGGGKSIIDTCEVDLKVHREFRRRIYRDFGQFNATLFGRYICAEDMNNTATDTREMLSWCRHVACLPEGVGGSGNPSRFTSLVGWLAARAGWKFLNERENNPEVEALDGVTIAIQGAGNVGFNLIDILIEGESNLKKILVADTDQVQIDKVKKLLIKKGKAHLLEIRNARDPLMEKQKSTAEEIAKIKANLQEQEDENTYILYSKCDVLVSAAVGNVIYEKNVDLLNCRVIVPVSNNTYSDNHTVGFKIWERKIVDVVEGNVNWGGATVAASEMFGYDEDHVIEWCIQKIYKETLELLRESSNENKPPWEIKKRQADEQIEEPHPVVKVAREGKFIVDISENFAQWIKERWLPNITSVGQDKFAQYVSDITQKNLSF